MKIKKILERKNFEEKEKKQTLLWFLVFLSMVFVLVVWFFNLSRSIEALKGSEINFANPINFDELDKKTAELNEFLQKNGENSEKAGIMDENWIVLAKEKIVQENFFQNEEDLYDFNAFLLENKDNKVKVGFDQYYKNVLVENGFILVYFDNDSGDFLSFDDNLKKGIEIDVDPIISAKMASEIISREISGANDFSQAVLTIVEYEKDYFLAWKVNFDDISGVFFVDAKDGRLFLSEKIDR